MLMAGIFMLAAVACAGSALLTPLVTQELARCNILDHPKIGSGHILPRPLGGGIAVVAIIIAMLTGMFWSMSLPLHFLMMLGGLLFLAIVSWMDDLKGLSVRSRMLAQILTIVPVALAFPPDFLIFQGVLPLELDRALIILSWLWFTNIMNLMDGIDGITGMETAFIGFSATALLLFSGIGAFWLPASAAIVGGAALGFLIWNWQPARIFIGDVGAIPLGFVCGWILMNMAASGLLLPAILLPLYHCFDATTTLGLRFLMRRRLDQRHRSHFFQRAIRAGYTHAQTVLMLALVNAGLFASALVAADPKINVFDIVAVIMGCLILALIMLHFRYLAPIPKDQL